MSEDTFSLIIKKLLPYKNSIEYITLHGCGELLLDKNLPKKIRIAKDYGFRGIGFASNCTELSDKLSTDLLISGLDTIICSVDGINKETHEAIRRGTNFEVVVTNIQNFIRLRNMYGKTRVLIRFIRQSLNKDQWSAFHDYWLSQLNKDLGDDVIKFDVHNWGEGLSNYDNIDINKNLDIGEYRCQDLFERLFIYSNGDVALCCADDNGYFKLGNVIDRDPIEIFNNDVFTNYRTKMATGNIMQLEHCKTCSMPRSRFLKTKD